MEPLIPIITVVDDGELARLREENVRLKERTKKLERLRKAVLDQDFENLRQALREAEDETKD